SDESNAVFQMELRCGATYVDGRSAVQGWGLVSIGEPTRLPGGAGHPKAEGLCVDHRGDLWVACETESRLFHLPGRRRPTYGGSSGPHATPSLLHTASACSNRMRRTSSMATGLLCAE